MRKHLESLISNGLVSFLGFLSFVILSRNCSPELFGEWVLFLSLSSFFDLVRYGLTRNAVVRLIASTENHHYSHKINISGLHLGIIILVIITAIFYTAVLFLNDHIDPIYIAFLSYYPLIGISNILWNNAQSWLQAKLRFKDIIWLRGSHLALFVVSIIILKYTNNLTFNNIFICYLISNTVSSIYSFIRGWDSATYMFNWNSSQIKKIVAFGRYSMVATLGSSLLKSADSFIISLSPILGVTGVAVFAIPFKIIEFLELPIRSIATIGYNHLSSAVINNKISYLKPFLAKYTLIMLVATLPIMLIIGLFPATVLHILGGDNYQDYMGIMTTMLYVLLFYGLILIPDRLTGVTLEALNTPRKNMYKVLIMALFNIIGDLIAVFIFESLIAVVVVSVLFTLIGVFIGYNFIPKTIRPRYKDFIVEFTHLKSFAWQLLSRK